MGIAFKLEDFGGMVPRRSPRLINPTMAALARNTKLLNGEARGFRTPTQLAELTDEGHTVRRAYRIQYADVYDLYGEPDDHWLTFDSLNVDILRSPLINDVYDRYYWAGDGAPKYNTRARILAGNSPYLLGVPSPTAPPTVTPSTAGETDTRAYVYTWVSAYGEEGQPSPPTVATGEDGSVWTIGNMATSSSVQDAASRNITRKRIYRTVPGQNSTLFFFVTEVGINETTHVDLQTDDVIASNNVLESSTWAMPESGLEGFVAMPTGYLVGWIGRRLVFSEPYRPHAWPAEYELSTEFEIVGLAVWGSTLIIGTKSQPYVGQGTTPASFVMQKLDSVEPCLSRRGMVATVAGAYYPSTNGLVLLNTNGLQVITQDILTKEEWATYDPQNIFAAQLGLQYMAFNSPDFGFIINPTEPKTKLVELDAFVDLAGLETDHYTGNINIIRNDRVYDWDPESSTRLFWRWKSKEFHAPKPINLGAAKIKFDTSIEAIDQDLLDDFTDFNDAIFAASDSLGTINGHAIHGVEYSNDMYGDEIEFNLPQLNGSIGGDQLFDLALLASEVPAVRFIAYIDAGDGTGKQSVIDTVVYDETMIRLPAGFKRDVWQFELISNTSVYCLTVGETGKDLAQA